MTRFVTWTRPRRRRNNDELVDLAVAVTSSSMYLELVDRMGHDRDRAAAMVIRLVRILFDHLDPAPKDRPGRTNDNG